MRLILGLLVALLVGLAPVRAEVAWTDFAGAFELKGADLFKLRGEMPAELQDSLKALRNHRFENETAFRAALEPALPTEALRAQWLDRLVGIAALPGAAIGTEDLAGMLTIVVAPPDRALDGNALTSRSWFEPLPGPGGAGVTTAAEEGCLAVLRAAVRLFRLCAPEIAGDGSKAVRLETDATHVVGLGQEFQSPGDTLAAREGWMRHGFNAMVGFNRGANGNTLIPVAYFDLGGAPFALVLDNRYEQEWDFTSTPYRLRVGGGDLRLRVLVGDSLAALRRQFMALSGHPPVPPRQMFGLWLSEYGFDNWGELDGKLASLDAAEFPLSGVVLDLYWFGGIEPNSSLSRMGSLRWDETRFPDPEGRIAALAARGIGTMLIEESYVSAGLQEFAALAERGGLAHDAGGAPVTTNVNGNWWGKGGMIDWTNPDAAAFWHDFRRQPLVDMGVLGHWTDLGEPEMVSPDFRYGQESLVESQVHNSYNLLWARSIFDGYRRNAPERRPFILSRSGGMGIQAVGGAIWSGDTGGDFGSLAAQMPQQQHMMWSGIDYYGSDIGGFHRGAMGVYPGDHAALTDELYTQWLAYSALFEVPVRPHTENLCNCKQTAPDRIGDVASNLANLRLRYALLPYYYSLAHRAWREGEPVFPSLDYYFDDAAASGLGHEKMIGSELVGAAVATPGATQVSLYLPRGDWYDLRGGSLLESSGENFLMPVHRDGLFALPLYARDGAIVPMEGGVLRVFGSAPNRFTWIDDDEISTAYQRGEVRELEIAVDGNTVTLTRGKGRIDVGTLAWARDTQPTRVTIDGKPALFTASDFEASIPLPAFDKSLTVTVY